MKYVQCKKIYCIIFIFAAFFSLNVSSLVKSEVMVEKQAVMALVQLEDITHQPINSGHWLDPATWGGENKMPVTGSRVWIPGNMQITVNGLVDTGLMTLRIDGELSFSVDRSTHLIVDTLVVGEQGILTIGSRQRPIMNAYQAKLIIKDRNGGFEVSNPESPDFDPYKLGQGVLVFGRMEVNGAQKQSYSGLTGLLAGEGDVYMPAGIPYGWEVGDELVISGVRRDAQGDEKVEIASINKEASIIALNSPLMFDHMPPEHTKENLVLEIHIANLTRNVVIETHQLMANNSVTHDGGVVEFTGRGHLMFMHSNDIEIRYAQLKNLGRTNKLMRLASTTVDVDGAYIIGINPSARYPVHFHRAGNDSEPGLIEGCSVETSPGWGYVNHSSRVNMINNTAFDVTGASFVSEAGDEVGSFVGNLSIKTHGSETPGIFSEERARDGNSNDLGHRGNGFWVHSRTVKLEDNIASGFMGSAYVLWGQFKDDAEGRLVDIHFTQNPEDYSADPGRVPAGDVTEILTHTNNIAYGGYKALHSGFITGRQEIRDFLGYAVRNGDSRWYAASKTYRNLTLIGDLYSPSGTGVGSHVNSGKMTFINSHIEGFEKGFQFSPRHSGSILDSGYFNNIVDIEFRKKLNYPHIARVRGNVRFGDLDATALAGREKHNFHAFTEIHGSGGGDGYVKLQASEMLLEMNSLNVPLKVHLIKEQAPKYIPYSSEMISKITNNNKRQRVLSKIDPLWLDKNNEELQFIAGTSVNGGFVPANARILENASNIAVEEWQGYPENQKPRLIKSIDNFSVSVGQEEVVINLMTVFEDPDGDPLEFHVQVDHPELIQASIDGDSLRLNTVGLEAGEARIRVYARNPQKGKWSKRKFVTDLFLVTLIE